jgi:SAM-dependent methyltransferase
VRLDDPDIVQGQYASEQGLLARRSIYEGAEGPNAWDVVIEAVAECGPGRVLEVGCGPGELAQQVATELDAEVVAVDISPRMAELAAGRGLDARIGDVQDLPFGDGEFDCAVAAWMLFHVPDLDRGVRELARVLRPGGRLVAATNGAQHLEELWSLVGEPGMSSLLSFRRETGAAVLRLHFARVDRRDVDGWVTFRDADAARSYISSSIVRGHLAQLVPELDEPLRAGRRASVFVAEKAT